jgi:hypothetical protein
MPALALSLVACGDPTLPAVVGDRCCQIDTNPKGAQSLLVVNGFTGPVDVLLDGKLAISALAAGTLASAAPTWGPHTVAVRAVGSSTSSSQTIQSVDGDVAAIAAMRLANGTLATAALNDTNAIVPAGATKARALHLAPNAGEIQIYRTQPDWPTPIRWLSPFLYQGNIDPKEIAYTQSTVGTWEVRAWQTPGDSTGWKTAPVKVSIPLASGKKATVVILDKPGGGIRAEVVK